MRWTTSLDLSHKLSLGFSPSRLGYQAAFLFSVVLLTWFFLSVFVSFFASFFISLVV